MTGRILATVAPLSLLAVAAYGNVQTPDVPPLPEEVVKTLRNSNRVLVREMKEFRSSRAIVLLDKDGRDLLDKAVVFFERYRNLGHSPEELTGFFSGLSRLAKQSAESEKPAVTAGWRFSPPCRIERGDIVLARSTDLWSGYFARASQRDPRFSHIAIVLEGGEKAVLLETNEGPDGETYFGKRSWRDVCGGAVDCAVYRYEGDKTVRTKIGDMAETKTGMAFDAAFDLKTKDRLYCAEMVRDAVNAAVGREIIGTSRKGNFDYVAIDNCYGKGFVKMFDAREWRPPMPAAKAATPQGGWNAKRTDGGRHRAGAQGPSTNRAHRIRIIPMH